MHWGESLAVNYPQYLSMQSDSLTCVMEYVTTISLCAQVLIMLRKPILLKRNTHRHTLLARGHIYPADTLHRLLAPTLCPH